MPSITFRIMPAVVLILVARLAARQEKPTLLQDGRAAMANRPMTKKEQLGKALFLDKNLSTPPGQACAHCHSAEAGFGQPDADLPVSRGVYPDRFGSRNDLIAAYAAFSPRFHYDTNEDHYVGGLFWDGRAANLARPHPRVISRRTDSGTRKKRSRPPGRASPPDERR
jgi:cytochrome c peroxidase